MFYCLLTNESGHGLFYNFFLKKKKKKLICKIYICHIERKKRLGLTYEFINNIIYKIK